MTGAQTPATTDRGVAPAPIDGHEGGMARSARLAWGAVAVILVGVTALLVYALTRSSPSQSVAHPAATPSDVLASLSNVPSSVFDAVGVDATGVQLFPPTSLHGQPPLTASGKPEVFYAGAEYCPFCAAERWPLIVALSRFGHFTTLHNVQSATLSVFPSVQSFSFVHAAYTSPYLTFVGVELYSTVVDAHGTYTQIATLTPAENALVTRYGQHGGSGWFPFVDVGNKVVAATAGFSPAVLEGASQATIVAALDQPRTPIGEAVVASANQLVAGICQATGQQPASVCTSKGTRAAAQELGLG